MMLHLGLFLSAILVLKGVVELAMGGGRDARGKVRRIRFSWPSPPLLGLMGVFILVLVYQGSWQLTGLFRPQFIAFMQSHDRRQFNPAHFIQRGRILDRNGEVLAYSQELAGQVFRVYPYRSAFAHTVGYSDPRYGTTGAEAAANTLLNGSEPEYLASWGELGRTLVTGDKRPRGQDLRLTLDARLQQIALSGLGDRHGSVVLMDPGDGALLVLANNPSFDPNRLGPELFERSLPGTPLLNRATQGFYPPGSTFKVVLAALALESGFTGTIDCPADGFTTSRHYPKIRDHEYYSARNSGRRWKGQGALDLTEAFSKSSNVFFAQLGVGYGHDALFRIGDAFAFDRQVPLFPGAGRSGSMNTGKIPRLGYRDLYGLAQASIGQGRMLATPAHMATIAAAVANDGLAMRPRLIADEPPAPLGRFMSEQSARRLAAMMRQVVTDGTGRSIDAPELAIAGKTGTAENPRGAAHSWFIGFAPADAPRLAVAVLVEHGGYGSRAAAPIARDLLLGAMGLGGTP